MGKLTKYLKVAVFFSIYTAFCVSSAYADDTEIFYSESNRNPQIPNILFIVDTSGSMSSDATSDEDGPDRLEVVQNTLLQLIETLPESNVGLSRFTVPGGPILYPVTNINRPIDPSVVAPIDRGINDVEEYTDGSETLVGGTSMDLNTHNTIGLRFEDLLIPQGALIVSASISFTSKQASSGDAAYRIFAENVDDAAQFTTNPTSVSSRTSTTASVDWQPTDWEEDVSYSTPELKTMVQEVVDRTGWCGRNAMSFKVQHLSGDERHAYTYETPGGTAPVLRVKYSSVLPTGATGCIKGSINSQVSASKDDFEFTPTHTRDGSYLNMKNNNDVGLRFKNILVPQGATIRRAFITFYACDTHTSSSSNTIYALDMDTATSRNKDFPDAAKAPGVSWAPGGWQSGRNYNTVDLSTSVQHVINRTGWLPGNDLGFYIESTGNERCGTTRDNNVNRAPKLYIEYEGRYQPNTITAREDLKNAVRGLTHQNWTPIADVMAEAGLYFKGEEVRYGLNRGSFDNHRANARVSHPNSYFGTLNRPSGCTDTNPSSADCKSEYITQGAMYDSPIKEACATNHIVFLSDGEPTWMDSDTPALYNRWEGESCDDGFSDTTNGRGGNCAIQIAGHLASTDLNDVLSKKQTVRTHTIGFGIDSEVLKRMALAGNNKSNALTMSLKEDGKDIEIDGYYSANDQADLLEAFKAIVGDIRKVNSTFIAPGLSVNQYNRLTHNDQLYFSLFRPTDKPVWEGNVKRYQLDGGKVVSRTLDANGEPKLAVDDTTGQFEDYAKSWWSSKQDGNVVPEGGVAEQQEVGRTLYSNLNNSSELTSAANTITTDNANITLGMLNAVDDEDKEAVIKWGLGYDLADSSDSTPHRVIGDPLHSRPTLVAYNTPNNTTTDPDDFIERSVFYVGTNNGYLHAFEAETGKEVWSFIPSELLHLLKHAKENDSTTSHKYGMDGEIAVYVDDANGNSAADEGESVYLYAGMRRGGNSYYAFDITDPDAPSLMFHLNRENAGSKFTRLGETWSRPVITRMNIGTNESEKNRLVMIFGGGYDDAHDSTEQASVDATLGDRVYIADALTGEHIWDSGSVSAVNSMDAVPSNIKAVDFDNDGLIDNIYVSDLKAQVFRFDVDNSTGNITGGRIANLQGAGGLVNNRRFYVSPDVAILRDPITGKTFVNVTIGSGYRANPLNKTVNEMIFSLRDYGAFSGTFTKDINISDLVQLNGNFGDAESGESKVLEAINDDVNQKYGWYYDFSTIGEKVMGEAVTFNNKILFTTYLPPSLTSACEAAAGSSRFYAISALDGQPYIDTDNNNIIDENDLFLNLPGDGISPEPQILLPTNSKPIVIVGRNVLDGVLKEPPLRLTPVKWRHIQD
ncbi:PilC/PilY family type IV pilus protein [Pleionea mediterranea]|uniref:Type IV pilus assembly protein PilY1 n=1 Tax=Pleionea mediterranea TaxID=523701 RepID=A0A316FQ57_9GAMM|nr:PilC/PilY family type IV pilus protein [Pleionea mediterranea]PWK50918.1 type IV pilus assembly protein PilY1 [Pleionea mediterranea]